MENGEGYAVNILAGRMQANHGIFPMAGYIKHEGEMVNKVHPRRASSVIMIVLGAILMLIAPEIWAGLLLLVLGVVLELAGIALGHKANTKSS